MNWNRIKGGTEWLWAKIVEIENGKYKVQIMNSPLFGTKFSRSSNEIRKYSSANDNYKTNEIVEARNDKRTGD